MSIPHPALGDHLDPTWVQVCAVRHDNPGFPAPRLSVVQVPSRHRVHPDDDRAVYVPIGMPTDEDFFSRVQDRLTNSLVSMWIGGGPVAGFRSAVNFDPEGLDLDRWVPASALKMNHALTLGMIPLTLTASGPEGRRSLAVHSSTSFCGTNLRATTALAAILDALAQLAQDCKGSMGGVDGGQAQSMIFAQILANHTATSASQDILDYSTNGHHATITIAESVFLGNSYSNSCTPVHLDFSDAGKLKVRFATGTYRRRFFALHPEFTPR